MDPTWFEPIFQTTHFPFFVTMKNLFFPKLDSARKYNRAGKLASGFFPNLSKVKFFQDHSGISLLVHCFTPYGYLDEICCRWSASFWDRMMMKSGCGSISQRPSNWGQCRVLNIDRFEKKSWSLPFQPY